MKLGVVPAPQAVRQLLEGPADTPVLMVNLLRFKEKADAPHTGLSGEEAYRLYAESMRPIVESHGGRFVARARVDSYLLGASETEFHEVLLIEYPSRRVFLEVMQDLRVHRIADLRQAGLEGQWLLATTEQQLP